MKKGILFILFILLSQSSFSQSNGICDYSFSAWHPVDYDSTSLSDTFATNYFYVDTSFQNNIWQLGGVSKTGFPVSQFGGSGLQTDTLNSYPINNESAIEVWSSDNNINAAPGYSLSFWHYYDVDSMSDSCIVQYSMDSGVTWNDYSFSLVNWSGMLNYDYNYDSILRPDLINKFLWTGKSAGWEQVNICTTFFIIGPQSKMPVNFGFRFLFKSDSVQTNKPGWVIDKLRFKTAAIVGAVHDYAQNQLNIYPNPSYNGRFTIDFPSNYVTGKFMVYDYLGRNIKTLALTERIDLSSLPAGLYSYKALFEKTNQWFSGKLEIR